MKEKLKRLLDLLKFDIFDNVDDDLILDKKAFKHLYKKIISNITTIISVTSVFIVMITMSFQVFYKINCNEYFGIPKKYFSYDFMELLVELLINFLRIVIFYYITYSCMSISIKVEKRHKKIFKIKTSFCKNILKIIFISITILP